MSRPDLIIVSGPPGAGKTHLARPLARRLGFPLLEKDAIKERLAEPFGASAQSVSRSLGLGAILVLYDVAAELLRNGLSVVIESTFYRGTAEADLQPLLAMSNAVLVHVSADDAVLLSRYERRMQSPDRHPVHNGAERMDELRRNLASGITLPPDLPVPILEVDTTYGPVDVEEIAYILTSNRRDL